MNQRGSAVLALAVGASTLIAVGTLALFALSRQVSREGARTLATHQSDEQMKNALIYTKKLIDSGCLTEVNGAWSVAADCTTNREWALKHEDGKSLISFALCSSIGGPALEVGGQRPPGDCRPQAVTVNLLEMVDSTRRRVNVRTTNGRFPSTVNALVNQAPAASPTPTITSAP